MLGRYFQDSWAVSRCDRGWLRAAALKRAGLWPPRLGALLIIALLQAAAIAAWAPGAWAQVGQPNEAEFKIRVVDPQGRPRDGYRIEMQPLRQHVFPDGTSAGYESEPIRATVPKAAAGRTPDAVNVEGPSGFYYVRITFRSGDEI